MTFAPCLAALLLAAPAAGDEAELELTVAGKPIVLRWRIEVDGKPCRAAWEEYERRLFADLDRDGNGHLDRREAARFPSAAFLRSFLRADAETETGEVVAPFARLDEDGDGRVSLRELSAYHRREKVGPLAPAVRNLDAVRGRVTDALFHYLDRNRDGCLSRDELRSAAETLQHLDLDEDEWWTTDEIAPRGRAFPTGAPLVRPTWRHIPTGGMHDRQLLVRLGGRDKRRGVVEVLTPRTVPWHQRDEETELSLGLVKVLVMVANQPENGFASVHRLYLQEYQAADAEGRGFVEKKHLEDAEFLRVLHLLADRDGDGKLTATELRAFLNLHAVGAAALVSLVLIDDGGGLFDLLDADNNGRLSVRELKGAGGRLKDFYRDGKLTRAELPRSYRLRIARGFPPAQWAVFWLPGLIAPKKQGPAWFRHMDLNGDGAVSLREFIGPLELFRKLDRDSDGLLGKEEAEQAPSPVRRAP